jgi:hypothetical protein
MNFAVQRSDAIYGMLATAQQRRGIARTGCSRFEGSLR